MPGTQVFEVSTKTGEAYLSGQVLRGPEEQGCRLACCWFESCRFTVHRKLQAKKRGRRSSPALFSIQSKPENLLAGRHAFDFALQQRDLDPTIGGSSFLRLIVFDLLRFAEAEDEHSEQRNLVLL